MKQLIEKFHRTKQYAGEFFNIFGVSMKNFHEPISGFDIIKFDDFLKKKYSNYEDNKTSMKDFIKKKYGKKAIELINNLL